jgi:hypothetical protein
VGNKLALLLIIVVEERVLTDMHGLLSQKEVVKLSSAIMKNFVKKEPRLTSGRLGHGYRYTHG